MVKTVVAARALVSKEGARIAAWAWLLALHDPSSVLTRFALAFLPQPNFQLFCFALPVDSLQSNITFHHHRLLTFITPPKSALLLPPDMCLSLG